jgi:aryl-alcohol dehydrogenase-like predicted oxidoreductase
MPDLSLQLKRTSIEMNYRTLGKTGLQVSEVGYGAWGIGKSNWIGASDDESIKGSE